MRRVEGQLLHALLPQVQQQGGVHHGNRVAAPLVAVAGGEVLGRTAVVALRDGRGENKSGDLFAGGVGATMENVEGVQICCPSLTAGCCRGNAAI